MIERHHDGSPFEAIASYCRAVRFGSVIAVSGTAAMGVDGGVLHPGDTYGQTRRSLETALEGIVALGGARDNVIRTRLYLIPEADWREAVRAHHEVFEGIDPANTTLFVAGLIPEAALVEVEVDAWVE